MRLEFKVDTPVFVFSRVCSGNIMYHEHIIILTEVMQWKIINPSAV